MNVLAVEMAQAACSVAIRCDGRLAAQRRLDTGRTQAEALLPMIGEALASARVGYGDLNLLAAAVGPGLFTGVRGGLAAVRAFRLVLKVPALGVGTLHAVAAHAVEQGVAREDESIFVVNDARNDEVYAQWFSLAAQPLGAAGLLSVDEAAAMAPRGAVVLGTAASLLAARAGPGLRVEEGYGEADAAIVAALAEAAARAPGFHDPGPPRPLYVRKPHARTLDESKR